METPNWAQVTVIATMIDDRYSIPLADFRAVFDLIKNLPAGSVIMELGVCHGRIASCLAYIANCRESEYHGIDIFELDSASKAEVLAHFDEVGVTGEIHQGSTNGYHPVKPEMRVLACPDWDKPIDLLIIDGSHDVPNVELDCRLWLPRVKPGGLVVFDDWTDGPVDGALNPHWPIKYWSDILCEGWKIVQTDTRLHIRRRPL